LAALAQIFVAAQRGDHLLTDLPTVTATFNDLEIGTSAGGLLAEIHWRLLCGEHKITAESASINTNKHETWHYTLARPAPRHQQLQGLTPNRPSQLSKISQNHNRALGKAITDARAKAAAASGTTAPLVPWNDLHGRYEMKRINHEQAYSLDGLARIRQRNFSRGCGEPRSVTTIMSPARTCCRIGEM
jgi:hypothetical protein